MTSKMENAPNDRQDCLPAGREIDSRGVAREKLGVFPKTNTGGRKRPPRPIKKRCCTRLLHGVVRWRVSTHTEPLVWAGGKLLTRWRFRLQGMKESSANLGGWSFAVLGHRNSKHSTIMITKTNEKRNLID